MSGAFKLTYSTMFDPPEALHERFEAALVRVRERLGQSHPHYIDGNLKRADGGAIVRDGIQGGQTFEGRSAFQISRRSNRLNPQSDTALSKLEKVLEWMRRPK